MEKNLRNGFLRNADPEALGGNGPAAGVIVSDETAPGAQAAAAAAAASAAEGGGAGGGERGPGFLQNVLAIAREKGALLAERNGFEARAVAAEGALASAREEHSRLTAEVTTLRAERAEIEAALQGAQASAQTVERAAASVVAGLGLDAAALPAAESGEGGGAETRASLEAELATAKAKGDATAIWAICDKLEALDD